MSSSPIPDIPSILYCGIPDGNENIKTSLLQSGSLQAGLTRLVDASGTLRTVNHEDHVAHRELYVIQLECMWPNGKARAIMDSKQGTTGLRSDGLRRCNSEQGSRGLPFCDTQPVLRRCIAFRFYRQNRPRQSLLPRAQTRILLCIEGEQKTIHENLKTKWMLFC